MDGVEHLGRGVEDLDGLLDLEHLGLADEVALVEEDDVGELDLVQEEGGDVAVVFVVDAALDKISIDVYMSMDHTQKK